MQDVGSHAGGISGRDGKYLGIQDTYTGIYYWVSKDEWLVDGGMEEG